MARFMWHSFCWHQRSSAIYSIHTYNRECEKASGQMTIFKAKTKTIQHNHKQGSTHHQGQGRGRNWVCHWSTTRRFENELADVSHTASGLIDLARPLSNAVTVHDDIGVSNLVCEFDCAIEDGEHSILGQDIESPGCILNVRNAFQESWGVAEGEEGDEEGVVKVLLPILVRLVSRTRKVRVLGRGRTVGALKDNWRIDGAELSISDVELHRSHDGLRFARQLHCSLFYPPSS